MIASLALMAALPLLTSAQPPAPPVPYPARPAPFFSWDTIPLAFHGSNTSGLYDDTAIAQLAHYQMVTLEKWYTPCGSAHPVMSNASCNVEALSFATFAAIKAAAAHRNTTLSINLYWNSMFNFAFYEFAGVVASLEAAGQRLYLRDHNDDIVFLCNDGDVYCNVTTYDHTQALMRELWMEAVQNATRVGSVDGIFADHFQNGMKLGAGGDAASTATLCNGSPSVCYNFTNAFATAFNEAHLWTVNATQDWLAKAPGHGAVIDGPWAPAFAPGVACDFSSLRAIVEEGLSGGRFVIEATLSRDCNPDESCLANFLCAAEPFTYLTCAPEFGDSSTLPPFLDAYGYALGAPMGPPAIHGSIVTRSFLSKAGVTNATVDLGTGKGSIAWAQPTPSPLPVTCGKVLPNTGVAGDDIAGPITAPGPTECCSLCLSNPKCRVWCWHGEAGDQFQQCHLHGTTGTPRPLAGATAGIMPSPL